MMAEQTIAYEPKQKMDPLSRTEDNVTSVSYALIPREVNVEVGEDRIFFKFQYPITENDSILKDFETEGLKFKLEKSTKKILAIDFYENHWNKSNLNLKYFNNSIDSLVRTENRDSVKKNYNFIRNLVHHFFEKIDHSNLLNRFD